MPNSGGHNTDWVAEKPTVMQVFPVSHRPFCTATMGYVKRKYKLQRKKSKNSKLRVTRQFEVF